MRPLPACRYLAISLLMLGCGPSLMAQTWNYSTSFSGSGSLPVSQTPYGAYPGAPADPLMSVTMTGTGTDVVTPYPDFPGFYTTTSTLQSSLSLSLQNAISPSPFSPTGFGPSDPGLSFGPLEGAGFGDGSSPFNGLFPDPPSSPGSPTDYSGNIGYAGNNFFSYGSDVLSVNFQGEADLILGSTVTETIVPDASLPGFDFYTFTYADSTLDLSANIGLADPVTSFTGSYSLTVVAAPDSSPGLVGVLTLLGVCAGGALQKKLRAA